MKLKILRTDGEVYVKIMKHKNKELYSYINLTKNHICPCIFDSIESAIEDLKNYSNVISYEVIKE